LTSCPPAKKAGYSPFTFKSIRLLRPEKVASLWCSSSPLIASPLLLGQPCHALLGRGLIAITTNSPLLLFRRLRFRRPHTIAPDGDWTVQELHQSPFYLCNRHGSGTASTTPTSRYVCARVIPYRWPPRAIASKNPAWAANALFQTRPRLWTAETLVGTLRGCRYRTFIPDCSSLTLIRAQGLALPYHRTLLQQSLP
jgi:hypothetical protein